jgi:hypothetical protein
MYISKAIYIDTYHIIMHLFKWKSWLFISQRHLRQARLEARGLEEAAQTLAKELAESEQMLGAHSANGYSSGGVLGKNRAILGKNLVDKLDDKRPSSRR